MSGSYFETEDSKLLVGLRILVAEDDADNRLLIGKMLESGGACAALVENGRDAVDRALRESYDVVMLDIQMPTMDGYQAVKALRIQGYARPIIALTARALTSERDESFRCGFDVHLTKPIPRKHLFESLRRALGRNDDVWPRELVGRRAVESQLRVRV